MRKQEEFEFSNDAQQQVDAFKQNAMADYKELWELRAQRQYLSDANQFLKDEFNNILTLLTDPGNPKQNISIAEALIGGKPVITSGGGSDSDFRWDGRRPDEEEEAYRRRCLLVAVKYTRTPSKKSFKR